MQGLDLFWGGIRSGARRPAKWRVLASVAVLVSGVSIVATAPAAHAVTITVTTTNDIVDANDGLTSIREAFNIANANAVDDSITLGPATTYTLTNCASGALTHTAEQALTISGNGATIVQSCLNAGILSSTGITVSSLFTVDNVHLIGGPNNGVSVDGAGIYADGRLVLTNSEITGVEGGPAGAVIASPFAPGGGGTTITITNSMLHDNFSTVVTSDFASASISGTTISNNLGSGISLVDGSPLMIEDSYIIGNTGGGARTTGFNQARLLVTTSTIADNGGTGLDCFACRETLVSESVVTGNGHSAPAGGGGGIMHTFNYVQAPVNPVVHIEESYIANNHAQRSGGGLLVKLGGPSEDPAGARPTVTITSTAFEGNTTAGIASHGAGAAIQHGNLQMSLVNFTNNETLGANSRGGGLSMDAPFSDGLLGTRNVQFGSVSFVGNTATGSGGGADIQANGITEITDATFSNNSAGGNGGGASLNIATGGLDRISANGNTATDGGGLWIKRGGATPGAALTRSALYNNSATGHGGGLAIDDIDVVVDNSTVSNNNASQGGGVSVGIDPMDEAERLTMRASTVASNTAVTGANAVTYEGELATDRALIVYPLGGGANCAGNIGSFVPTGRSFLSDVTCGVAPLDTVSSADPMLGALANNGGTTLSRLPAVTSPIGGLISAVSCTLQDQRSVLRPQGAGCEPGAVEIFEAAAISGTSSNDLLIGTQGNDVMFGFAGTDVLTGLGGNDRLDGGDGADLLIGGPGIDILLGGRGVDVLIGTAGDTLVGGVGVDVCWFPGATRPREC